MSNTAQQARDRLTRLSFEDWKARVNEGLEVANLTTGNFPDIPFDYFFAVGHSPGRVAEAIVVCVAEARKKGSK